MQVIIVGTGKLATELLNALQADGPQSVFAWGHGGYGATPSIVVHAGSGRELEHVMSFCQATRSTLVELATGSVLEAAQHDFPVVLCPNTNILMLKFMSMLEHSGPSLRGYRITLTESHQVQKTSTPGTALSMAHALGLQASDVRSVRDAHTQNAQLHIPQEHLGRHAYHQITIEDTVCSITMETRVYGASPYADGVGKIIAAVRAHTLEDRRYDIGEFVDNGWV